MVFSKIAGMEEPVYDARYPIFISAVNANLKP
jgi:hypothetical protein